MRFTRLKMAVTAPKLNWCVVRLGNDTNWWVEKISDEIHWDIDGLSILDPRQFSHLLDLIDPLRDYGFNPDLLEATFFGFSIEKDLKKGKIRLTRSAEPILESEDQLFALPDIIDEEKGPYADFLNHITKLRIMMLNDLIDFEKHVTIDELEEELRDKQQEDYMEGKAVHVFDEITGILEYIPEGYELDDEEPVAAPAPQDQIGAEFPDVEEETIVEDETMKWEEEEEEEEPDKPEDEKD